LAFAKHEDLILCCTVAGIPSAGELLALCFEFRVQG
jgi:hypothetical protein